MSFNTSNGVSLVFINTEKGKEYFDIVKNSLRYKECAVEDTINQLPLYGNISWPDKRSEFWSDLNRYSFARFIMRYNISQMLIRRKNK